MNQKYKTKEEAYQARLKRHRQYYKEYKIKHDGKTYYQDHKVANLESSKQYSKTKQGKLTSLKKHLKSAYGITVETYKELLKLQNYCCKICGSKGLKRKYKEWKTQQMDLFIDHCHKTNKVRGLLCHKCNAGLAMFEDNVDNLAQAIVYLNTTHNA